MDPKRARSSLVGIGVMAVTFMLSGCATESKGSIEDTLGWEWQSEDGNYFVYVEFPNEDVELPKTLDYGVANGAAYMTIKASSTGSRTCENAVSVYANEGVSRFITFGPSEGDRNALLDGSISYKDGAMFTPVWLPQEAGTDRDESASMRKFVPSSKSRYDENVSGIVTTETNCRNA